MERCIECGEPVDQLYVEYGKGSIRLKQCVKVSKTGFLQRVCR